MPGIMTNIGIALLLLGMLGMRSHGLFAGLGLPPYTGLLVMAAGALLIMLSFVVPSGTDIPHPRRVKTGAPAEPVYGQVEVTVDQRPAFRFRGAVYELRKPAEQFFASFGAPEWMDDSDAAYSGWNAENLTREEFSQMFLAYTTGYFYSAGIEVRVDGEGLIKSFNIYTRRNTSGDMRIDEADFRTSLGITRDSRAEDIIKAYGRSSSRHTDTELNVLGQRDDNLYYRFGDEGLSFNYTDGSMRSVCLFWDPKRIFG